MASASGRTKRRTGTSRCTGRRHNIDKPSGRACRRRWLDQCVFGIGMVRQPVRTAYGKLGAGAAKGKIQTALVARVNGSGRAAGVVSGREFNTPTRIRTAVKAEGHRSSSTRGSGGARGGGDCSKGVAKRIGSGNPVARSAHVDSGWLRCGPSKHRKIGPIIAGSCQMEIDRANSHRRAAARVNLNRTRGASEHGD